MELSRKLARKQFSPTDIQTILQTLVKEALLSNQRFLENFIHYRRNKGYGPLRIHAELLERGLPQDLIEQSLNTADEKWQEYARFVWKKRFKNTLPSDFKARVQQIRFLQYRGFTQDQIESIFKK
ncbi:MAG TPA: regulatory protein RecX [Gammaproteobacteria bacterium]|nr:regulatory protein RecX [Gammaproteobacteria bacterium]